MLGCASAEGTMVKTMDFSELKYFIASDSLEYEAACACLELGFGDTPSAMYLWALEQAASLTQPPDRKSAAGRLAKHIVDVALNNTRWSTTHKYG
jgi:hypothetical protein